MVEDREYAMLEEPDEVIKCITHNVYPPTHKTWCGKNWNGWAFVDIDHAALNGQNKGRLVACHKCVDKIMDALNDHT